MAGNIIQFKEVTKKYGELTALDNVSIHVNEGAIYGIIGGSGSGRSTALKLIANMTDQTSGQILIKGEFSKKINHIPVGCLVEEPDLDGTLSVWDNMMAKCLLTGAKRAKKQTKEILDLLGLSEIKDKRAQALCFAEKRKLGIAMAVVGWPGIVLLDEPVEGLDEEDIERFIAMIMKLRDEKKMTFVITGNFSDHLERVGTDFAVMTEGKLLKEVSAVQLRNLTRKRIKFVSPDLEGARESLMRLKPRQEDEALYFNYVNDTDMLEIERAVREAGVQVTELSLVSRTADEIFDRLVNGGSDD